MKKKKKRTRASNQPGGKKPKKPILPTWTPHPNDPFGVGWSGQI